MITSLKTYLKVCFPLLYGHLIASFILLRESFKKYKYDSYSETEIDLSPHNSVNDVATSLFLRVICEANYENVVEVGTYKAGRICTLKRLVPQINAYGIDIGPTFSNKFHSYDVNFQKYDDELSVLKNISGKTLVICRGTLSCMESLQLSNFVKNLSKAKADIAIYDLHPNFLFNNNIDVINRTNHGSFKTFYHNYNKLFLKYNFTPISSSEDTSDWLSSPYGSESWRFLYFHAPTI